MAQTTTPPTFSDVVDQSFFIEPLSGPLHPRSYLDRFPDEVYTKAPDSHLVRFLYALLGPAGVGWLKKNLLDARIQLEDAGLQLFDLEGFYGDPFSFGRILDELYDEDPTGLLPRDKWDRIKARDEAYRNRAVAFFNAARAGGTPEGMSLAARSALNHRVDIVENYHYLFDIHSDEPLGLPKLGQTNALAEFIVIPRRSISTSQQESIGFTGYPDAGTWGIVYNGRTTSALSFNSNAYAVQAALEALPSIGPDNVKVEGGPANSQGFLVTFQGSLSNQTLPGLSYISNLTASSVPVSILGTTSRGALDAHDEIANIPSSDQHHLEVALDRLRPVGSLPTFTFGRGTVVRQQWQTAFATSSYNEVLRYVTGSPQVSWPSTDSLHWIVKGSEIEAPRIHSDLQHHYVGYHNIVSVTPYIDGATSNPNYSTDSASLAAYKSTHMGAFEPAVVRLIPFFGDYTDQTLIYEADRGLADYPEPLTVTTQTDATGLVNGIYPTDYANLPGVPQIQYREGHFWASRERQSGAEYLEIDLGSVQAVNFLSFELISKPIQVEVSYDVLDQAPRRQFAPIVPIPGFSNTTAVHFDPRELNPWSLLSYNFTDALGLIPFTRFIRIKLTRDVSGNPLDPLSLPFAYNGATQYQNPWSIEVRNLRLGRNVSDPTSNG